jgi:hypothetical protein
MTKTMLQSAVCALALAGAIGAANASDLIDATDPNAILNIAKGFGSATLEKDSGGDPKIAGRIEGVKYGIYFYGCEAGKSCTDIQFAAGWSDVKVSLEKINEWNRGKRFGKAYLDKVNDPMLELSVNINHGVSVKNLEDSFEWWKAIVNGFQQEVLTK